MTRGSTMSSILVLTFYLVLSGSSFPGVVHATFYRLPRTWSIVNNASLDITGKSGDSIRVILMDKEYDSFALAFFDISSSKPSSSPDDRFVLGIVTMPYAEASLWNVVWCANWGKPVKHNATLGFKTDGNLGLWDADGGEVWGTTVSGGLRAAGLAMEKSGNLLLVDASNNTKWESFYSPSDTILPDQWLPVGSTLTSRTSSISNEPHTLKVERAGLALYAPSSKQQAPYWIFSLSMQQDLDGILASCAHPATVVLDYKQGLVLTFDEAINTPADLVNSTTCGRAKSQRYNAGKVALSNSEVPTPHQFVRLDSDGNLQLYVYTVNDRAWKVIASVINSPCELPSSCNSYGICDGGKCSCGGMAAFVPVDLEEPTSGCKPSAYSSPLPMDPSCLGSTDLPTTSIVENGDLVQLTNVDYFSNRFVTPNSTTPNVEECSNLCVSSCTCSASFYHNDTGACFLVDTVHSLQAVPQPGYFAQLKISAALIAAGGDTPFPASGPEVLMPRRMGSNSNELAIGLSVGIGGAGLLLIFFIYTLYKIMGKRKGGTQVRRLPDEGEDSFLDSLPGLPPRFSLKDLQMATTGFHTRLGSGGFGTVYEGVLVDGTKVAVKRLEGVRQGQKEFRAEVASIGSIHHINLVTLRGFCAEGGHRLLVYEFMAKGSLDKWLFAPKDATNATDAFCLDWNTRFKIAVGTGRGLSYLHNECSSRIIHMDIKPQNILLDTDFFPKVSDFGLSKLMDHEDSGVFTSMRGTPGYLAPELLLRSQVSEKIDIYSYGIVLIELLTGRKSIDMFMEFDSEYFPSWAMNMARDGRLRDALDKRMGDLVPEIQLQRVINIAYWCVHRDFRRRPSMKEVVQMLENLIPVPAIPQAELADLSSFKLPRRLSFNNDPPPLRLQRAHSDQGMNTITARTWIASEDLSGPR